MMFRLKYVVLYVIVWLESDLTSHSLLQLKIWKCQWNVLSITKYQGLHLTKLIFIHKANYERELTFASQEGNVFVGYGCDPEQCITNSLRNLQCLSGFTEYVFASQQLSLAKPLWPKRRMKKIAESKADRKSVV